MSWWSLRDSNGFSTTQRGRSCLAVLRWLRLRSCLPGMLGGLRVAAPAAILGSILAEFGSGARWGLGSFLLGSLGRGNPARIWGIGLTATAMADVELYYHF